MSSRAEGCRVSQVGAAVSPSQKSVGCGSTETSGCSQDSTGASEVPRMQNLGGGGPLSGAPRMDIS